MAHAMRVAGIVCFGLAAIWPALPASSQGIRLNLTALGLALEFGAAFVPT